MSGSKPPSEIPASLCITDDREEKHHGYLRLGRNKLLSETGIIYTGSERFVVTAPINDNEVLLGGSEGGESVMLGTNLTIACGKKDSNDSSEPMNSPMHRKGETETEDACPSDLAPKPSESGERMVDRVREEIEDTFVTEEAESGADELNVFPQIETVTSPVSTFRTHRRTEQHENDIGDRLKHKVGRLLEQDTLETDLEAFRLLKEAKVQAAQRFEDIHTNPDPREKKRFSEVSPKLVNSFARHTLKKVELDDRSLVYIMGSGYFNDDLYFVRNSKAHVVGVDSSKTAVTSAQKYINVMDKECALEWIEDSLKGIAERHGQSFDKTRKILLAMAARNACIAKKVRARRGIGSQEYRIKVAEAVGLMNSARDRIEFHNEDYLNVLNSSRGMGIDVIFSNSSLHYFPPHILREIIFPMVAAALRDIDGNVTGKFFLAMKLHDSASAQSEDQVELTPNSLYHPSYHKGEKLFRTYLEGKEEMVSLAEPSFDMSTAGIEVVHITDYDKTGDTEKMCWGSMEPKKEPMTADELDKLKKLCSILNETA